MKSRLPAIERVLAVLAAASLVGAVALAALEPPLLPLGQLLAEHNHALLLGLRDGVRQHLSVWIWNAAFVPVLLRPAWFLPLGFGLVFAGAAISTGTSRRAPGSPRWRN
ncbi:MAG: hypothetical protein KGJ41_04570 [Rhodospirillales bacterium]|nr:hypothetical protein [Rhodospirillales bacterium]MDE2198276.1 hypothetical protein [Rhodospirillales bacterium]MDE2574180.1 hypothetical protein [Rhodospirillales bacterium]